MLTKAAFYKHICHGATLDAKSDPTREIRSQRYHYRRSASRAPVWHSGKESGDGHLPSSSAEKPNPPTEQAGRTRNSIERHRYAQGELRTTRSGYFAVNRKANVADIYGSE